jgi:primosomal protein N' (replication factor Y) (superfamily II helicase)
VVIQAYNVDDYSLQAVLTHDYTGFYRQEIAMRQKLWLPPFCHIGMVILSCILPDPLEKAGCSVSDYLAKQADAYAGLVISEAMPAPIPLLGGRHRMRILVRHAQVRILKDLLASLLDTLQKPLVAADVDIVVDIDPGSMV